MPTSEIAGQSFPTDLVIYNQTFRFLAFCANDFTPTVW